MIADFIDTPYGQFSAAMSVARLDDLCEKDGGVQTGPFGSQLHQEDYVPVGTPIITVEHLGENRILQENLPRITNEDRDRLSRYQMRQGDIIFSRVGSVDRRALVRTNEDGWLFSGRCLRVRPDPKKIDPAYLSYFFGLSTFKAHIRSIAVGATMPSINTQILSGVPIVYPQDIDAQRAIAHILGTLDDKIELNRRMNETLEAMARAIFKSWFVDFAPVRAKASGEPPESICRRLGLTPDVLALFPDGFQDSELGKIPAGWRIGRLDDLCQLKRGHDLPANARIPGDVPVVSSSGVSGRHTEAKASGPGVITGRYGTIGKVFYIEDDYWPLNTTLYVQDFKENPPRFVFHVLEQVDFSIYTDKAAVPGVNRNHLHMELTSIPPPRVRQSFARTVAALWSKHAANERQSRVLATLRDALLPRLLSGELPIPQGSH